MDNRIWIISEDDKLQLRLFIIAHTTIGCHRGRKATETVLGSRFYWATLSDDVELFVQACIHCLSTTERECIPRPFGPSVHGTKPNELLQFDYIELGKATTGSR